MHHLPTFTWMNAVRIHPHIWHQGICLRVEFYGMDSSGEVLISKSQLPNRIRVKQFIKTIITTTWKKSTKREEG